MYTLRTIKDNIQTNECLGKDYKVIERHSNYEEFQKVYLRFHDKNHVADLDTESDNFSKENYIFIIHNKGSEIIPLYKDRKNYIMTENGKTFSNLSYK